MWEPQILEREYVRGTGQRLGDPAAGWRTQIFPLVVGDLGALGKSWKQPAYFDKREVSFIARNCQFESLCAAIRIL